MGAGCCKEEEIDFDAEGKQAYIYSIFMSHTNLFYSLW